MIKKEAMNIAIATKNPRDLIINNDGIKATKADNKNDAIMKALLFLEWTNINCVMFKIKDEITRYGIGNKEIRYADLLALLR